MPLVIGPLDGLGLEGACGPCIGLEHDLGLGVAQAISLVGITSQWLIHATCPSKRSPPT